MEQEVLFETDWLASTPVFYDEVHGNAGTTFQEVISGGPIYTDIHAEGLFNYLDFGYSVFGQTPLKEVRFLGPSCRLLKSENQVLTIEQLNDPLDRYIDFRLSESDLIELIRERTQAWEASLPADQEIVLPLSGGYDSRLLLWSLKDPSRVRAYTYGISKDQSRSMEVTRAAFLANHFGVRWKQIQLGEYHKYLDGWNTEFGLSTHAHGMYHFEFYEKIREELEGEHALLSGIIGDVWAGSVPPRLIERSDQLVELGYTHGLCADPSALRVFVDHKLREQFWQEFRAYSGDYRHQIITTLRLKIILLSYLLRVPRLFGFEPWSPFLDIEVAMGMLNLPLERRANREWQRDFFSKVGLDLESRGLTGTEQNSLDYNALKKIPVSPLNREALARYIEPDYVDWVNRNVRTSPISDLQLRIGDLPLMGRLMRKLGVAPSTIEAYSAYQCLLPLEKSLSR
ncbi:MAG: asparagine synthase-related protein [Halioglobus sp.]